MIRFEDVSKSYGPVRALDHVSFEVEPGEVLGYIGPNGAGKTTSIKVLTGLIASYEGTVSVDGRDIRRDPVRTLRMVGYLPQDVGFQEWRTVSHAMELFGRLSGLDGRRLRERVGVALETVGLAAEGRRKIAHLSGGMVQRLRLAQALLHEPAILVLDEPLSGLDPGGRAKLKDLIRNEAARGTTVFFSSHILSDVEDIANRIAILTRGSIMRVGTPAGLCEEFRIGHEVRVVAGSPITETWESVSCVDRVDRRSETEQILRLSSGADLDEAIEVLLRKIVSVGLSIRSFELLRPSLEDVYLHYVKEERQ